MWPKWFLNIYHPTLPSHAHTTINFEPHDIPMSQHLHHTCFENKKHHGQTTWIIVFSTKSKENHAIHLIHIIFHTKTKISMNINSVAAKANRFPMVPHENQAKPWPLTLDIWPWAMAPGHGDISLGHGNESWAASSKPPLHSWGAMWIPWKSLENQQLHQRNGRNQIPALGEQEASTRFFMQIVRNPWWHVCVLHTNVMKNHIFFFSALRGFFAYEIKLNHVFQWKKRS